MGMNYQNKIREGIFMPIQQFMHREKSAGIVLGMSIVAAMLLANSPWSEDYFHLFEHKIGFMFNGEPYLYYSLHHWINDGLMSLFFFVVGLELKREKFARFLSVENQSPVHDVGNLRAVLASQVAGAYRWPQT